ncbi:MAG: GNAT family N-acetyltransferase [Rhodobacteraceae bacterium]|nr:GNAT family N-acetyltransferase [Paracoccaceae bacterium]
MEPAATSEPGRDGRFRIRPFRAEDALPLRALYYRAVQEGAARFYDQRQRDAWARAPEMPPDWRDRLGREITLVAEDARGPVGFMTLGHDGHLDLAFVAPEAMGTGIAAALHDRLLVEAEARGIAHLTTEASHLARRFFLRQGWREIAEQQVDLGGVRLTNFRMEKRLGRGPS